MITDHEGFPNVLLEYMLCGKPVIASNVGGVPEIITNENGILFTAGKVDQLTNGLITLISDADLRHRLGNNGKKIVTSNYSLDQEIVSCSTYYRKFFIE